MEFDFNRFLDRLQGKALSKQEAARIVYDEIRAAENQKVGFLDQATENPQFYSDFSSQVDNYITCLKVLHNKISPHAHEKLDEKVYMTDKGIIDRTMELVQQLEQAGYGKLSTSPAPPLKTDPNDASGEA
ncbi:hypothetical protein [Pontibacter harenae]|uniref:hypothetical protein n=1 Tax=Pontibacter harenae TaxID=2894083 RepID=UPI001E399167|nr:hypothetical protein [Pontibacter harenae]MCC9169150.1 hypothetical protein [Pontibacter harenae]